MPHACLVFFVVELDFSEIQLLALVSCSPDVATNITHKSSTRYAIMPAIGFAVLGYLDQSLDALSDVRAREEMWEDLFTGEVDKCGTPCPGNLPLEHSTYEP